MNVLSSELIHFFMLEEVEIHCSRNCRNYKLKADGEPTK